VNALSHGKKEYLMGDRSEVQNVLDRFARAITAGDGRAAADIWETPALVLGDEQVMTVSSPQEVEQFFGGGKEQYNARRITDTRPEIVSLDWPTRQIAIVEVRWPYLDADGRASAKRLRPTRSAAMKPES
jgi:hypothetical protein